MRTLDSLRLAAALTVVTLFAACGSSSGDDAAPPAAQPAAFAPAITQQPASTQVMESQPASFSVVATGTDPLAYQWQRNGVDIAGASAANYTLAAATVGDSGATFRVTVSNIVGSVASDNASLTVNPFAMPLGGIQYFKASNTQNGDAFGQTVALSADGSTLAVAARREDSGALGIGGNQADESAGASGAVYIFAVVGGVWSQQAYVKASNTGAGDEFGFSLALSADGNTLAVGALDEDSIATGIDGNQADNSVSSAGAVYVFTRTGSTWNQQAYVKASNTASGDSFGISVALSADGSTLAVGAIGEDSNATGIGGDQINNAAFAAGAVYVFARSGAAWTQQAYVKASNTGQLDNFGSALALAADGNTLAVSAPGESSDATGIDGNQASNLAFNSGAVYVFVRAGAAWTQQVYVKASNTDSGDFFGDSLALSADGNTLAVGTPLEDSDATGINGDGANDLANFSGAAYMFVRTGTAWSQQAYIKASNTEAFDLFGLAVALNADGNTLVVGAPAEDSNATGLNGDQTNNSGPTNGAAYVFKRSGSVWQQSTYAKQSTAGVVVADLSFGISVAVSGDASTYAVGAFDEDGNATGVNGVGTGTSLGSGAVFMY